MWREGVCDINELETHRPLASPESNRIPVGEQNGTLKCTSSQYFSEGLMGEDGFYPVMDYIVPCIPCNIADSIRLV